MLYKKTYCQLYKNIKLTIFMVTDKIVINKIEKGDNYGKIKGYDNGKGEKFAY